MSDPTNVKVSIAHAFGIQMRAADGKYEELLCRRVLLGLHRGWGQTMAKQRAVYLKSRKLRAHRTIQAWIVALRREKVISARKDVMANKMVGDQINLFCLLIGAII